MNDPLLMHILQCDGHFTSNGNDKLFFKTTTGSGFHEGVNAASAAVLAYEPELRVQAEGVVDGVDILCARIFELLQNPCFVDEVFDSLFPLTGIETVIGTVDVENLYGDKVISVQFLSARSVNVSEIFQIVPI